MNWLMRMFGAHHFYLGQVRRRNALGWETVTGRCNAPNVAMARALLSMSDGDVAARVILVNDAPQGPTVVKEVKR